MEIGGKYLHTGESANPACEDEFTHDEENSHESRDRPDQCLREYLQLLSKDFVCECLQCDKGTSEQNLQKKNLIKKDSQNAHDNRLKDESISESLNVLKEVTEKEQNDLQPEITQKIYNTIKKKLNLRHNFFQNGIPKILPFACDLCLYKTHDPRILTEHKKLHNVIAQSKPFGCNECDYKTKTSTKLTNHIKKVHSVGRYKCYVCDFKTKYKINLQDHNQKYHPLDAKCTCDLCSFNSEYSHHVKFHLKKYQGSNDCNICLSSLRMFYCYICKFETYTEINLNKHKVQAHTDFKKYKCDICLYCTYRSSNLKMHQKIHVLKQNYCKSLETVYL